MQEGIQIYNKLVANHLVLSLYFLNHGTLYSRVKHAKTANQKASYSHNKLPHRVYSFYESIGPFTLQWRHNDHDGVSNHQLHGCLLNRLFSRRSKKASKLRVPGLCVGNSPGPVNSPHKGPVTWKMFPFDDVIMISHITLSHDRNNVSYVLPIALSVSWIKIINLLSKHNINFPECIWNMIVKSKIHMNFEIVTSWISSEDQIMIYTSP